MIQSRVQRLPPLSRGRIVRAGIILVPVLFIAAASRAVCQEPVIVEGATPPTASAGMAATKGLSQTEAALIATTNAARARNGLQPLVPDGQLMNGARNHARWMASNRSLSHGGGVTENIGMGQTSASEAVSSWMQSSGHRANILGAGHTRIGVAMAHSADGTAYWCQQFR